MSIHAVQTFPVPSAVTFANCDAPRAHDGGEESSRWYDGKVAPPSVERAA